MNFGRAAFENFAVVEGAREFRRDAFNAFAFIEAVTATPASKQKAGWASAPAAAAATKPATALLIAAADFNAFAHVEAVVAARVRPVAVTAAMTWP